MPSFCSMFKGDLSREQRIKQFDDLLQRTRRQRQRKRQRQKQRQRRDDLPHDLEVEKQGALDLVLSGRCSMALDPKIIALHVGLPSLSLCDLIGSVVSVLALSHSHLGCTHTHRIHARGEKPYNRAEDSPIALQALDYVIGLVIPVARISETALRAVGVDESSGSVKVVSLQRRALLYSAFDIRHVSSLTGADRKLFLTLNFLVHTLDDEWSIYRKKARGRVQVEARGKDE